MKKKYIIPAIDYIQMAEEAFIADSIGAESDDGTNDNLSKRDEFFNFEDDFEDLFAVEDSTNTSGF